LIKPTILDTKRDRHTPWKNIIPFFIKYNFILKKRKYKPCLIFNLDEVSLSTVSPKKEFQVVVMNEFIYSSPAPLTLSGTTALFTIAADGSSLPSVILINQKKVPSEFLDVSTENLYFIPSANVWMNTETFELIFEHILLPAIKRKRILIQDESAPSLMIVDGHISRRSGKFFSLCIESNIDVLCLPSHLSHVLQPLDLGVNACFKNYIGYHKNYFEILTESHHRIVFAEILLNAINKSLSVSIIKRCWRVSGLYPLNPYVVLAQTSIITPEYFNGYHFLVTFQITSILTQ
jgi:hypothetical protein